MGTHTAFRRMTELGQHLVTRLNRTPSRPGSATRRWELEPLEPKMLFSCSVEAAASVSQGLTDCLDSESAVVVDAGALQAHAAAVASAEVQTSPLPDLIGELIIDLLPGDTLLPGEGGTVGVAVRNVGDASAVGKVNVRLYLSSDTALDPAIDTLAGEALNQSIKLAPGAAKTVRVAGRIPTSLLPGLYYILAAVDTGNTIQESNEANNATSSQIPAEVVWKFGSLDEDHRNTKLTLQEADGTLVTFALAGPGYGQVTPGNGVMHVDLRDTTGASSATITTKKSKTPGDNGLMYLGDLTVGDPNDAVVTGIKQITAKGSYLLGRVVVEGPLAAMTLGPVASTLIDLRGVGAQPSKLTFGRVLNLDLFRSASPIASLTATEWLDFDNFTHPNRFEAPSVGAMTIKGDAKITTPIPVRGDLETEMILTDPGVSLGKLTVNGSIREKAIRAAGDIGSVTVGRMYFAEIYAGVRPEVTGLPASASSFVAGSDARIGSVTVKGLKVTDLQTFYAFTNSDIAAPRLGKISLTRVWQNFGGRDFGVAGNSIESLKVTQDGKTYIFGTPDWNTYPWDFFQVNDFS